VTFFQIYGGKLYDLYICNRHCVCGCGCVGEFLRDLWRQALRPAQRPPQTRRTSRSSVYLIYWYKSTNTNVAARADAKQVGYSVYLLYWYKSTDTDAAARADAKQVVNIVGLQETEVTNVSHLMEALNAGYNDSILYMCVYICQFSFFTGTRVQILTQEALLVTKLVLRQRLAPIWTRLARTLCCRSTLGGRARDVGSCRLSTWLAASAPLMSTTTTGRRALRVCLCMCVYIYIVYVCVCVVCSNIYNIYT
jgi:hypothetical protein